MDKTSDTVVLECAQELLVDTGMLSSSESGSLLTGNQCVRIESDGSTRRFWRLARHDKQFCIIAAPAGRGKDELAESRSAWKIGNHLRKKGVPVPEIYAWDSSTGVLLFEDLGDMRLHDFVKNEVKNQPPYNSSLIDFYRSTLEHLAAMQCKGADGFAETWCWDSPRYDLQLMVERESGYFLRAFWQDLMGRTVPEGVEEELLQIARLASEAPTSFFLHRDFQSRNIMIKEESVRFIDFQGGRFGPLGYDLASLLLDPYSSLSTEMQEELVDIYLDAVNTHLSVERSGFKEQFKLLALQRNMQIVGAFSFLYRVRKKVFFMDFIKPALLSLQNRLEDPLFMDFPLVCTMVKKGLKDFAAA